MSVGIVTDSAAYLDPRVAQELNIRVVALRCGSDKRVFEMV